jgi:hypothetical protein
VHTTKLDVQCARKATTCPWLYACTGAILFTAASSIAINSLAQPGHSVSVGQVGPRLYALEVIECLGCMVCWPPRLERF